MKVCEVGRRAVYGGCRTGKDSATGAMELTTPTDQGSEIEGGDDRRDWLHVGGDKQAGEGRGPLEQLRRVRHVLACVIQSTPEENTQGLRVYNDIYMYVLYATFRWVRTDLWTLMS